MLSVYVPIYNSAFCADYQIKTLKTFLKDDHTLIFIDNNLGRHPSSSNSLKKLCSDHGVPLIVNTDPMCSQLQEGVEEGSLGVDAKLGWTLNLMWAHVKQTQPKYFGFLDQDCFLFKETSMIDKLERVPAYGKIVPTCPSSEHKVSTDGEEFVWNLHVISNFYKTSFLLDKDLGPHSAINFMPGWWGEQFGKKKIQLDVGGMNWHSVWKNEELSDYAIEEDHYYYYDDLSLLDPTGEHPTRTLYEILDGRWIHMVHGATAAASQEYLSPKTSYIKGFLDNALIQARSPHRESSGFISLHDPRRNPNVS